jgi:hypothetical protein
MIWTLYNRLLTNTNTKAKFGVPLILALEKLFLIQLEKLCTVFHGTEDPLAHYQQSAIGP